MIYAANIAPAAVFEDNDSFSAPNDFTIRRSETTEDLQKYITRDKYSKQEEPSMDTYVAAYRKFHERYQIAEEKHSDEINKENQNNIDHHIRKRSAPKSPSTAPKDMIKFELSDAKVPHFMLKTPLATKVPSHVADAVYNDVPTTEASADAKASSSQMIKIIHPMPSEYKRSNRQISFDRFNAPRSRANFKLYVPEKQSPFASYKGLYNLGSSRGRYAVNFRNFSQNIGGSGQNLLGPLQTPGLLEYGGQNWGTGQSNQAQSRPTTQFLPTKKPPQYGYTIPRANDFSTLNSLNALSNGLSLIDGQRAFNSITDGATATDSNRFGEPFRSSLLDPTFDGESLSALTSLLGKAPTIQLKELQELLRNEQMTRPQDSTSPILFHPTTESTFPRTPSTTPASVEFFPDSQAGRLSFEDITRFYGGGGSLPTPFTPPQDHKPIVETVTEHPVRPTPPSILLSRASVTVKTPEDVLRIPESFQAAALLDSPLHSVAEDDDKHVSSWIVGGRNKRNSQTYARELRNIPVRDFRNSFDPLVLREAFPIIGNRNILMTPLPNIALESTSQSDWMPVTDSTTTSSTFVSRYVECLRRKNNAFLRTFKVEFPQSLGQRVRRSAKNVTVAFEELAKETLTHLSLSQHWLNDPEAEKFNGSTEYFDYEDYDFDENATLTDDFSNSPFDPSNTSDPNLNSSRRYDFYEDQEEGVVELADSSSYDEESEEYIDLSKSHSSHSSSRHHIEYQLVPVTLYKKVPVLKHKNKHKRPKWHPPKRYPRFRKHKRRPRRPKRFRKYHPFFKLSYH
ncbi:hypothetical protein DMENIID0001_012160 [Sergentomyia squamirostris]